MCRKLRQFFGIGRAVQLRQRYRRAKKTIWIFVHSWLYRCTRGQFSHRLSPFLFSMATRCPREGSWQSRSTFCTILHRESGVRYLQYALRHLLIVSSAWLIASTAWHDSSLLTRPRPSFSLGNASSIFHNFVHAAWSDADVSHTDFGTENSVLYK